MDDQEVIERINQLAGEEHELFEKESRGEASEADQERLSRLEISLDDLDAQQASDPSLKITFQDSKATVAAWSYLNKFIICGHENGTVSQYDAKVCLV